VRIVCDIEIRTALIAGRARPAADDRDEIMPVFN
jgi:hypothetical protein